MDCRAIRKWMSVNIFRELWISSDHSDGLAVVMMIFPVPFRRLKKLVRSAKLSFVRLSLSRVERESIMMISGSKRVRVVMRLSRKVCFGSVSARVTSVDMNKSFPDMSCFRMS